MNDKEERAQEVREGLYDADILVRPDQSGWNRRNNRYNGIGIGLMIGWALLVVAGMAVIVWRHVS